MAGECIYKNLNDFTTIGGLASDARVMTGDN